MAKGVNIPLTISGLRQAREDLEKLNDEFEKVKNDPIESKKIAKEFNELSKAVDGATEELIKMNNAGQLVGTRFDDLNEVLFQTQEEVLPLTSQIGEMEDRMYQLAAAGDTSSKEFKALQSETARLRKVIVDTDRSIDGMVDNAGSLGGLTTAFGELGDSVLNLDFKRAGVAIKGLSTQFQAFGRVLLANPIFLIVAVVAAIVAAVVSLKDKVAFLGAVFDFFAGIVNDAVQALKDFLDWIGLTNFAEQDLAQERKERAEENLKNIEANSSAEQAAFDRKIALLSAEGKSTVELEIAKQKAIIETAKARQKEIIELIKAEKITGDLTKERLEELGKLGMEQVEAVKDANNQIKILEINKTKEYKEELGKRKEAHETYLNNRLEAERMVQDLELQLMEEGREKMLLQNQITYERLREDTLENEKLTAEEKLEINKLYDELEAQSKLDILVNNLDEELAIRNEHEEKVKGLLVKRDNFIQSQASKDIAREKEVQETKLDLTQKTLQLASGITELFADKSEKAAKIAFNVQKVASIAQATMDGYKAVLSTYAQTAGGPVIKGIAAGIAGSFAALQIANIAKTKFEGGGGGAASVSSSAGSFGGGGATASSPSTPSFELFGDPNDLNNVQGPESVETNQQMTVKAVVVESDITSTQNKVAKMQKNAEL